MDYTYDTLDEASIRLFKGTLGTNGQIQGRLSIYRFFPGDNHPTIPPYQAISYTWGSSICTHNLHINGKRLPVLDAIHAFLRQMLSGREEVWWWIDSICIDQKNEVEKGSQLTLMSSIFASAEAVRVWLGEEVDDSALALQFLGFMGGGQTFSYHGNLTSRELIEELHMKDGPYAREWSAVNKLFKRSWWTRVWTMQEFVVAEELSIHCGESSVSRMEFQIALVSIYDCGVHLDSPAPWNRERLLSRWRASGKSRIHKLSGSLMATLAYMSDHHATDPRDRIYSLLGIVKDFDLVGFPDYSQPVEVLFVKIVEAFVRRYRCLDVICLATTFGQVEDAGGEELPSWVPDWRRMVHPLVTPTMVSQGSSSFIGNFRPRAQLESTASYRASGHSYSRVTFIPDLRKISCHGFVLGKIDGLAGSSSHQWNSATFPADEMIQSTGDFHRRLRLISSEVCNIMQAIMRCLILDRQDHYLNDAPQGDEFLSQFQTLLAIAQQGDHTLQNTFRDWFNVNKSFQIYGTSLGTLTKWYLGDKFVAPSHGPPVEEERKSFYSRFHDTTVKMSRRLQVMEDGYLGTAPSRAQKGDLVCILFGCNVPVVLRQRIHKETFEFVGECYVDRCMSGEALERRAAKLDCVFQIV
jgi:hypothetical protein